MPTVITQGAASAKGYGFGASATAANYIEDVFSTYLYTGTGASQTITNGVDLSTKGGMVWIKSRSAATNNFLFDTARGTTKEINSNTTDAEATLANSLTAFNTDGFTVNSATGIGVNAATYASWTFRKQAKFFDVVTYTGNGTANRSIAHNLGSTPGAIFIKRTDSARNWAVYHRSTTAYDYSLRLNTTDAQAQDNYFSAAPDATNFYIDKSPGGDLNVNANGGTYVAYLFAHDAGGFGATGSDNVISCGSYNGTGSSTVSVTLGFEPQWVLIKKATGSTFTDGSASWCVFDNMRGIPTGGSDACLYANLSDAENNQGAGNFINVTATGFEVPPTGNLTNQSACSYIYIAIRRGPMKTPTTGTSVFVPYAYNGSGAGEYTTGINQDLFYQKSKGSSSYVWSWYDRLRGPNLRLQSNATNPESSTSGVSAFNNESMTFAAADGFSSASPWGGPYIGYAFRRAPGFFDVVCYTGTGVAGNINHNLGVAPELIITKKRSAAESWWTWCNYAANSTNGNYANALNATWAYDNQGTSIWGSTVTRTSTAYSVGSVQEVNGSGITYVAYLFATLAGVSKVGSYTGTAALQTINCGFIGGARFVLIKRTDSTGDWYVWDSARGISSGNDPYLLLNSTAAEVTGTNYVDTTSTGFQVTAAAPAGINANGGTYIFLAIA